MDVGGYSLDSVVGGTAACAALVALIAADLAAIASNSTTLVWISARCCSKIASWARRAASSSSRTRAVPRIASEISCRCAIGEARSSPSAIIASATASAAPAAALARIASVGAMRGTDSAGVTRSWLTSACSSRSAPARPGPKLVSAVPSREVASVRSADISSAVCTRYLANFCPSSRPSTFSSKYHSPS